MLNEICDNIKTAIVHGRTDIIRSILDTCKFIFIQLLSDVIHVVYRLTVRLITAGTHTLLFQ